MFVSEVLTGIFGLLTKVLQNTPTTLSHKQLSEVCSLLHEFYNRNGFAVFSTLLQAIGALFDDSKPQNTSSKRTLSSPASSPGKSPVVMSTTTTFGAKNATCNQLYISLLSSYERLINTIQKLKIEYLHKVGCSRHTHKSCDLSKLVPVHHSLLGEHAKQTSLDKSNDSTQSAPPPSTASKKINEHLRKISLTAFRYDDSKTTLIFVTKLEQIFKEAELWKFLDKYSCLCFNILFLHLGWWCSRGMGSWRNFTETQQSGHASRSGPAIKNGRSSSKDGAPERLRCGTHNQRRLS